MKKLTHPMQPVDYDPHGVIRFKPNRIINHLFMTRALDLNALALLDFPNEDWEQLAQLLGYSICGFSDLSYVRDATYAKAEALANEARAGRKKRS